KWLAHALTVGAFFFVGSLHIQMREESNYLDTTLQPFAYNQEVQVVAHVTRNGQLREEDFGEVRQMIDVEAEEVRAENGEVFPSHSGIRVGIYARRREDTEEIPSETPSAHAMRIFKYGERIRFTARLKLPRNFRNPGAFDYRGYLADRGIAVLASTKA